ncbi:hypothetical protein [Brevibacterium otitidis]|uniref:Uncharacterized protein n=1 Tax=Brevibacterium otitidis TaxID=53364 RepID=A0ABV5X300_9MICO|nr:hypothetical protein GCM10023233_22710 [Brevibacterium otitidis]
MAQRMIGPNGRDVLDVPASGIAAMRALGWEHLDTAPDEQETTPDTQPPSKRTTKTTRKPSGARRRVPKPGDDD